MPKDCKYYNLPWIAKSRGYATSGNNEHIGDGVSIVPNIINNGEVGQFETPIGNTVGGINAHCLEIGNSCSQKKATKTLYSELFNEEYYKTAYENIKSRESSMTPGLDKETLDGFSKDKIRKIIESMKNRSFKFKPSRRIEIPKPNGKMRKVGIPNQVDKIVQKVVKGILEEIFEPIFLDTNHGFRPSRGTHTALKEIKSWTGVTWSIEGDIKGYFDNIDHKILANLLAKVIKDKNIIDLY